MAEQPEAVEAGCVGDRERVGDQPVERVGRRVGRLVAVAVAAMVERHDGVVAREHLDVVGEVEPPAPEAVHQQETRSFTRHVDRELDAVVHRDAHLHMVTRIGPTAPGDSRSSHCSAA